jgi:hypothetical protein
LLIQLDAAKRRGGIEPLILGRDARGGHYTTALKPLFSMLVQTDPAILENPAGQVTEEDRQQEFGAAVDPLYLFSCGMLWHQQRDAGAGWELIQFLRSRDKGTRAIAAALLAKTEHARLLVRDLRRARVHGAQQGG